MKEAVHDRRSRSKERNWIDLPPEILCFICKKLPDIYYFILFRAVCKTWRSSVSISDHPNQLPWILEQPSNPSSTHLHFHTMFTTYSYNMHTINLPNYSNKFTFAVSKKYMLTSLHHVDSFRCEYSLLNPFTDTDNEINLGLSERDFFLNAIGPVPNENDEYLILSIDKNKYGQWFIPFWNQRRKISFRRLTNPQKVLFELEAIDHGGCLYYNGEYFHLDKMYGITKVVDIATQKLTYEIQAAPNHSHVFRFIKLFESNGEIFMVRTLSMQELRFEIYRLNLEKGKTDAHWVKLDGIGDRVLFLDNSQVLCFNARDYPVLRRNHVYMLYMRKFYMHDLKNHSTSTTISRFSNDNAFWFLPSLC